MTLGSEQSSVQRPFLRYAVEAGWTYLPPDEALRLRHGGITSPVLDTVLVDQLQRLNPGRVTPARAEDTVKRLVRVRPCIEGNLDAWEYLKGLKTVFIEEEKRERNIRLLADDDLDANRFHVTDEFAFSNGTPPDVRADIIFFINGIPVLLVETKKATDPDGIDRALGDIRYYHQKAPELLVQAQLYALTHLVAFHYGATWNLSRKGVFNWREEAVPDGNFEALCKAFVAPERLLRALTDCILFTRKDEELSKVVLRPHQMRAVERCVARARDKNKRRGLVWHTQGSGKTYTMIVTALRLMEDPAFQNPTVLMIVDRNELEAQLFANLEGLGVGQVYVARTRDHLRRLLARDRRGLIVSMIHKFDKIPECLSPRPNIIVLVDEAHRTTGGDLGNYLMGALPNATYLGFTGTPIDRTVYGKGTFKVFGTDDARGYLDKYSIRESVLDKTTVPLHYALAPNELRVDRDILEREFLALAELEGVSDIEVLNKVLERAVTLKNMLKNRDRILKVAEYVAKHYRETVEPMGYKAFLVAVDREACCRYKEALDEFLPPEYSQVVISHGGKKDSAYLRRFHLSEDNEKAVRKAFRNPGKDPNILIVTEKLLTGYDAPILYCMYLDKPMRDHVLLQAIARVNRPYEDDEGRKKTAGFVLDFVGIFDNLERALAFDSQDVKGVIEGLDVLRDLFAAQMRRGRTDYLPILEGSSGDKQVEAVLEHFRDKERRDTFYKFFRELQDVYEILSPDAFLRPFMADYEDLTRIFHLLLSYYERGKLVDRELLRKTALLVQEHTETGDIEEPGKFHALSGDALEAIASGNKPDTVKIFNLLKAIHDLVLTGAGEAPYLLSIGEQAEKVAQAFEQRQTTTQQALDLLEKLIAKLRNAEQERKATGLMPEAFAVYYFLQSEEVPNAMTVAREAEQAFKQYPHWQTSAHQEQDLRRALYKALIDGGVETVVEMATKLMTLLRRAQP
ncbi:MAG: HsdR family type I site-specific deoxyribonuclease [Candidatus Hydrogenedentes bacterium]|nr:HsdR family type I site-specific deoxyribonuclease [Candidatus Hydrogenedentota bacterium]